MQKSCVLRELYEHCGALRRLSVFEGELVLKPTIAAALLASLALAACAPERPEIHMPVGHPANSATAAGKAIGAPGALQPELVRAEPEATKPAAQAPNPLSPTDRRNRPGAVQQ